MGYVKIVCWKFITTPVPLYSYCHAALSLKVKIPTIPTYMGEWAIKMTEVILEFVLFIVFAFQNKLVLVFTEYGMFVSYN